MSFYDNIDINSSYVQGLFAASGMIDDYNRYLNQYLNQKPNNAVYQETYVSDVHRSSPVFATYYPGTCEYATGSSFQERTLSN